MTLTIQKEFFRIGLTFLILGILITVPGFILPGIFSSPGDGISFLSFLIVYGLAIVSISIIYIVYRIKSKYRIILLNDLAIILKEENSLLIDNDEYSCMICKQSLKYGESIISCLNCGCYFHLEHLNQWFNIDTHCPVCFFDYKHILTNSMKIQDNKIEVSLN